MTIVKKINCNYINEALHESGLDWDVEFRPVFYDGKSDGWYEPKIITDKKCIVRKDNDEILGIVGNKYKLKSNEEIFSYFDELIKKYNATYKGGASIDGGKIVFLQAKLDNGNMNSDDDIINNYLTLYQSFDGNSSLTIMITPIRMICDNQLAIARNKSELCFKIPHLKSMSDKMKYTENIFLKSQLYYKNFMHVAKIMRNYQIEDDKIVDEFIDKIIGEIDYQIMSDRSISINNSKRKSIIDCFENGMGNNGETVWDLYNAVSEWTDHRRTKHNEQRLKSSMFGDGFNKKIIAFNAACDLCKINAI